MSQDDQRNQPNEEPRSADGADQAGMAGEAGADQAGAAREAGAGELAGPAGATAASGAAGSESAGPVGATAGSDDVTGAAASGPPEPAGSTAIGSDAAGAGTSEPASSATATTAAEPATTEPAAARPATARREFREPGEGAPRYAVAPERIPSSGSEDSWSAAPNPGYQRDPAINYPTKRVVAGTLIGALLMAGFVVYAARILTNRSGNGNGSAPWTAAVERDGAVVGGINAQNNGSAPEVPAAAHQSPGNTQTVAGEVFSLAVLSCRNARATTVRVTNQTGTPADITAWSHQAAAPAQELRTNAAALRDAVNLGHPGAVASAANSLCSVYPAVAAVPPMPDAAGSQAWSAAVTSFSTAATQSLQAVLGNPNAKSAALDALAKGEQELNAMSARINSVA